MAQAIKMMAAMSTVVSKGVDRIPIAAPSDDPGAQSVQVAIPVALRF
jgi:hypothetical protein